LLIIHPVIQFSAILVALYVMQLGAGRAAYNHFGWENRFNWKSHVVLGRTAFFMLLTGLAVGLLVSKLTWNGIIVTGIHAYTGLLIALLIIFGIYSGIKLNSKNYSYNKLKLLHGLNNTLLLLLMLYQMYSGFKVYTTFIISY
jgi:hypothetical protein